MMTTNRPGFCLLVFAFVHALAADEVLPVYEIHGERVFDGETEICHDAAAATHINLPMEGSTYSIEGWVMPDEVSPYESFGIVGWGVPGRNQLNGFIFYRGSDSLRNIWWQNDLQANLEKPLADGSYHHVAATWDGNMQRIFVDFVQVASKQASGYGVTKKVNFCVGTAWHQDGSRAKFRGKMKDVKIWNIPISADYMKMKYEQQRKPQAMQMGQSMTAQATKYVVCTQLGFLNIHSEPGDPFRTDNVVGRWSQGDIIEVIDLPADTKFGPWLKTSRGWSIQIYGQFHWLRPVLDESTASCYGDGMPARGSSIPKPQATQSIASSSPGPAKPMATSLQSELDEEPEHEGVLSLYIKTADSDADIQKKLTDLTSTYREALGVALQEYFGFAKVWFHEVHASSGRQLRSRSAEAKVHFRALGGDVSLTNVIDGGLKTEIQDALDAAGADILLVSVCVEWKNQGTSHGDDPDAGTPWVYFIIGAIGLLACFGFAVVCYMMACKKKGMSSIVKDLDSAGVPQAASPTIGVVHVVDAVKVKKEEDVASVSTAEGDGASDGTASTDEPDLKLY
mmetsp:Transcript_120833/g.225928  ORF Transcript_120833/g.225928 Transcript_120833/m.225928 type:complete len:567 (+) Transcript_120833:41-1741(+)